MAYGTEWIKKSFKVEMSAFGEEVAEFLNVLGDGIYHFERSSLKRVDWSNVHYIEFNVSNSARFATFDFDWLTRIVVLSHDRCIRVEIGASSPQTLKLFFHKRQRDAQETWSKMPTLESHVEVLRNKLIDWN